MPTTLSRLTRPRVSPFGLIAALLTLLVGATVYAAPPSQEGGNVFNLTVTPIGDDQVDGDTTTRVLMLTANTDGTLNGTLSSEVTCEVEPVTQKGICHGMATFEGDVKGAEGTLVIEVGLGLDGDDLEAESFTILSGTDELAGLQGEGTFSGNLATADGTYTLDIRAMDGLSHGREQFLQWCGFYVAGEYQFYRNCNLTYSVIIYWRTVNDYGGSIESYHCVPRGKLWYLGRYRSVFNMAETAYTDATCEGGGW